MFLQRWFVDGSVQCFTGSHLPLAIVAMLILICYILLIIFVTAVVLKKIEVSHDRIAAVNGPMGGSSTYQEGGELNSSSGAGGLGAKVIG